MTFEEIMRIDRKAFCETWVEDFSYKIMVNGEDILVVLSILLFYRYWEKFRQIYQKDINFLRLDNLVISKKLENWMDEDKCTEIFADYEGLCTDLFSNASFLAGFEVLVISTNDMPISYEIWNKEKKARKREIQKLLRKSGCNRWKALFWKELSSIVESCNYLENGEIYLMQNRVIGVYKRFCRKYEQAVKECLAKEEQAIEDVLGDLKYPLFYNNLHDEGYLGDNYYLYFDTGCNGYEYLTLSSLSMNWVISCVVLGKLLRDFREKVYLLMDIRLDFGNI